MSKAPEKPRPTPGPRPKDLPKGFGPRRKRLPPAFKLSLFALVANIGGIVTATWVAMSIRAVPASEGEETLLFVAYYTAMVVAAVADALLLDEVIFKGGFRRAALQGADGSEAQKGDIEGAAASMQRSNMSFPVLLLLAGGVTYYAFNLVNHNFNSYYRRVGKYVSALRGDDPTTEPRRLSAIADLSIRREPEIVPTLTRQLHRGGEVSIWAAWALGRFTDVQAKRRRPMIEPLLEVLDADDPRLCREAIVALSRLQYLAVEDNLRVELRLDLDAGGDIDMRLLYAAGYIQRMSLVPLLEEILRGKGSIENQRAAAWALFQHIDQEGGRAVVDILVGRLPAAPHPVRCAIVHSLGYTGDEQANLALIHAHDAATPAERTALCDALTFYLRPDGGDERVDLLLPRDVYEMKILQAMGQIRATSPEIRAEVEPWLTKVIAAATDDLYRSRAQSLLDGIRLVRDDTQPKQINIRR